MTEFVSFFVVLLAGMFFSVLFNRLHLPWVVALIVSGIAIGPQGFGWFTPTPTIDFLGEVGLVFLMFMAGLETRFSTFRTYRKGVLEVASLISLVPFVVGVLIAWYFGFARDTGWLLGVIFISSSIAVVVPALETSGLFETRLGKTIVGSTILADVLSLALLSILLQNLTPVANIPLPLFYIFLVIFLIGLRWVIPKIKWLLSFTRRKETVLFQQELRLVFTILIGVVVVFELLGLHTIIAGFFAGLVLSEATRSKVLDEKLKAISYGLFIPVFFVLVGARTDLSFLFSSTAWMLTAAVVGGLVVSKMVSGWVAGRWAGFNSPQSLLIGFATIPQLSTSLAVAFTARASGLLDDELVTSIVVLTIVTTLIAPIGIRWLAPVVLGRVEKGESAF